MLSTLSVSMLKRQPRITYQGIKALGDKLDGRDWRLFASILDQELFTDGWIEHTETICGLSGRSATKEVLRDWQKKLSFDQDVPVQDMIDVLLSKRMGRIDAASVIEGMMTSGTFLDYDPDRSEPQPSALSPLQSPPSTALPRFAGAIPKQNPADTPRRDAETLLRQRPEEGSYYGWADETSSPQPSIVTSVPHPHCRKTGPPSPQPQNFTKSNRSLDAELSYSLHRRRHSDRDFSTWPQRGANKSGQSGVYPPVPDELDEPKSPASHLCQPTFNSISPLRSVDFTSGAPRFPVLETGKGNRWFITFAYHNYKLAMKLGMALKAKGQEEVMVDTPTSKFTSLAECQRKTTLLFRESTHILVLYTQDYYDGVTERENSPLNTRFIYNLMAAEYQERQNLNCRFVPIIDHDRVSNILPMFRQYPRDYAEFVCHALQSYVRQLNPGVRIERTLYVSGTS